MKIFITYSRASKNAVLSLTKDLEELGHDVWIDHELKGGQSWWDNILRQIRECEVYVFALSREALDSVACNRELKYAEALQKSVLPVLLETNLSMSVVPRYLSNIQGIDYSNPNDKNAVFGLLKAISSLPPSPPVSEPYPVPPPVPISYLDKTKDKIDSAHLDKSEQISLVNELKNKLHDPENKREDIYGLLKRLRRHEDLFASVALEIDQLLVEEPAQGSAQAKPPKKQLTHPTRTKPNRTREAGLRDSRSRPAWPSGLRR